MAPDDSATAFVGKRFTLAELRGVYEAAWGTPLDPGNFRRKVLSTEGFVEETDAIATPGPEGGKPARIYKPGRTRHLSPPLSRPMASR